MTSLALRLNKTMVENTHVELYDDPYSGVYGHSKMG